MGLGFKVLVLVLVSVVALPGDVDWYACWFRV